MAAVENILANTTAPRNENARAPSKVPFAPILASQIEARLSDLAAPRATPPANTDRFEEPRDDYRDDRAEHVSTRHDDRVSRAEPRADTAPGNSDRAEVADKNVATREPESRDLTAASPREYDDHRDTRVDKKTGDGEPSSNDQGQVARVEDTDQTVSNSTSSEADAQAPAENKASSPVPNDDGPSLDFADAGPLEITPVVAAGTPVAPDGIPTAAVAVDPTLGARGATNVASIGGASTTPVVPITGSGSAPDLTGAAPGKPGTGDTSPGGKINITGMTPSNDDAPGKLGADVPQVVRDVQSIVARPANAAGVNLVQAQQQGDVPAQQALATPTTQGNAAPLAQNAGQGASLHVGADGNTNSGQNTGQNSGQSTGNPNGQTAGGQTANAQPGIAGAPTAAGVAGDAATAQQAAQSFQANLARGAGTAGAGGPGTISGDGAGLPRGDAAMTSAGATQGPLASDPASRAAQATPPPPSRHAPATDQVSVSLKKAVQNGDSTLRIQLRPHDLGKVEVKLDIAGDGRAKAMVLAERPETLELLQRDSRVLERALQDAGLKTDHNSLSFDLQGRDGEERAQHAQKGATDDRGSSAESSTGDDIDNPEQPIPATAIGLAPDGSINFLA